MGTSRGHAQARTHIQLNFTPFSRTLPGFALYCCNRHLCGACVCMRVEPSGVTCGGWGGTFGESLGHVGEQQQMQRLVLQVYSSRQTVDGAALVAAC